MLPLKQPWLFSSSPQSFSCIITVDTLDVAPQMVQKRFIAPKSANIVWWNNNHLICLKQLDSFSFSTYMWLNHIDAILHEYPGTKAISEDGCCSLCWEDCDERIDLAALSSKEPILFYDEVANFNIEKVACAFSFVLIWSYF